MSEGILLFENASGAGSAGTSEYVKDEFQDTALPASSNSGFSSTVSTNPLNQYFGNSVCPRWMTKTLWIKDLQVVDNKSLWINNKPTYKIIFHEDFQGVEGYCYGAASLNINNESRSVLLNGINDAIGVGGIIRRVQWLVKPGVSGSTNTATKYLDGSNGSTIDFTGIASNSTYALRNDFAEVVYNAFTHATSDETRNIHDYRLIANQSGNLNVYGVVVYFNIDGSGLDLPGGDVYNDKNKLSPSGTSLAFPAGYSTFLGGKMGVFISSAGTFGLTSSFIPEYSAQCTGASGTNLLSVATGVGGSFPQGTGVYVQSGSTHYLGMVTQQSGDVLTVSPTLAFGLSNVCRSLLQAGYTFSLGASIWQESFNYSPNLNEGWIQASTPVRGSTVVPVLNLLQFSDPQLRYRATGFTLSYTAGSAFSSALSGTTYGLQLSSTSLFNFEGRASAMDFEFMVGSSSILHATFIIDGIAVTSLNESINSPSIIRRRIFTNAGMGWHSVQMSLGSSLGQVALTKVVGYEPKLFNGPTLGALAEIPIYQTLIIKNNVGASSVAFGNIQRLFADNLYLKLGGGDNQGWQFSSGSGATMAGGVIAAATDAADSMQLTYFGTQFAVIGTGGSFSITFDGSPVAGASLNTWLQTSATLGFHTVVVTENTNDALGADLQISAVDYFSPVSEIKSLLKLTPTDLQSKAVSFYNQASEPTVARPGDIWQNGPLAYQKLFGGWQRVNANQPLCIVGATATQNFATSANIYKNFAYSYYDPFGMKGNEGGSFWFAVPSDGHYLVSANVQWSANATGIRSMILTSVDASQTWLVATEGAISGNAISVNGSAMFFDLKKGNRISVLVQQTSGATLGTTGDAQTNWAYCMRIGP